MSSITNIQQVLSNISGLEKVQHVQQQQSHAEQARHTSEGQKSAEIKGKKIEDKEPAEKVDISVNDDREGHRERQMNDDKDRKEEICQGEGHSDNESHIDITV